MLLDEEQALNIRKKLEEVKKSPGKKKLQIFKEGSSDEEVVDDEK